METLTKTQFNRMEGLVNTKPIKNMLLNADWIIQDLLEESFEKENIKKYLKSKIDQL